MAITDRQIAEEVRELIQSLEPTVVQSEELVAQIKALWNGTPTDNLNRAWRLFHSLPNAKRNNEEFYESLKRINDVFSQLEGMP